MGGFPTSKSDIDGCGLSLPLTFYPPKRNTKATIRFSVKNSIYLASVHEHKMQFKRFMVAYNCIKYDTQKKQS